MLKPLLISLSETGGDPATYSLAGRQSSFSVTESGESSSDLESYCSDSSDSMEERGDTEQTPEDAERHATEERWREFEKKMKELDTTGTGRVLLGKLSCQWGRIVKLAPLTDYPC